VAFPIGYLVAAAIIAAYVAATANANRFPGIAASECPTTCTPGGDQYCCSYTIAEDRFGINNLTGAVNPADVVLSSAYAADRYGPGGSILIDPSEAEAELPSGTPLHGWYFVNATDPAGAVPGCSSTPWLNVLYSHGSGWNIGVEYRKSRYEWLLSLGKVRFFVYDYPGYGLSGGDPTPESVYESSLAALRWFEAQAASEMQVGGAGTGGPEARGAGSRVVMLGRSLGGNLATRLVAETVARDSTDAEALASLGGKSRSLALWSSFTSWRESSNYIYPLLGWAIGGAIQPSEGYRTAE